MQQRKAKVVWGGAESAAAQEIPAMAMARNGSWPEVEGASEHSPVPRKKRLALDEKRWNTVVNVMLVAFVMAVPPVIVVFAGGGIVPSVWIAAAKAQLRRGEFHVVVMCLFLVVAAYGFGCYTQALADHNGRAYLMSVIA
jgi:xyloglucan fucosyltransferase